MCNQNEKNMSIILRFDFAQRFGHALRLRSGQLLKTIRSAAIFICMAGAC
jgi:hypothetical protein